MAFDAVPAAEQLMLLLEHVADIVQRLDGSNRTVWISPSVERLTGWTVQECLGDTRWDLVHPDDAESVADLVLGLRTGRVAEAAAQVRLRVRHGSYAWWSVTAKCLGPDPASSDVVLAFRNVDREMRQQEETRRQERLRVATLESMLDPVTLLTPVWDSHGTVLAFAYAEVNAAAGKDLGRDPADVIGRTLEEVLDPEAAQALLPLCASVAQTGVPVSLTDHELPSAALGGAMRRFDLRAWPVDELVGFTWRDVTQRHAETAAVAASESSLRLLMSSMAEGVLVHGPDGRVVRANPAAERIVGLTAAEMTGRGVVSARFSVVRADGTPLPDDEHPVTVCLTTGEPVRDAVVGMVRPDGVLVWLESSVEPLRGEGGSLAGAVATFGDVTARITAERDLRESQARYRMLAEHSADVVLQTGPDGAIVWASPSVEQALGYAADSLVGRRVSDLLDPDEVQRLRAEMAANVATGRAGGQRRIRFTASDGRPVWMSALGHAVNDESGIAVGGVDALRDIDAQVRAEQSLAESEEVFRTAMDSAPIGVCLAAPDGTFLRVNPALCALLGRDEDALLATAWQDLTHPADLEVDLGLAEDVLMGRRDSYRLRKRFLRPDGSVVHGDLAVGCVRDADGGVRHFVSQIVDVTAEHVQQVALAADKAQLSAILDAEFDPHVTMTAVRDDTGGVIDFIYTSANRACLAYLGVTADTFVGARMTAVYQGDAAAALRDLLTATVDTGEPLAVDGYAYPDLFGDGDRVFDMRGVRVGDAVSLTWRDVTDRHLAAQALQSERARLRAVMDASLDPHVLLDAVRDATGRIVDFCYADANDAACAYNRVRREDLVGMSLLGLLPAHADTGLLDMYAAVVETGQPLVLDDYAYPHDILAEPRRFDIRAVRVGDALSYTWRDVTDRSETAARVAASEARLAQMLDTMAEGVVVIGSDGTISAANPAARRIVGLSQDEMTGRSPTGDRFRLIREDGTHLPPGEHPVAVALTTGEPVRDMVIGMSADNHQVTWVRVSADPLPDAGGGGTGTGVVSTFSDITAQVVSDRALAASEERYRILARNATDVVYEIDPAGVITWTSDRVTELLGWSLAEVLGRPALDLIHPDDRAAAAEQMRRAAQDGLDGYRVRMRTRDGQTRWVDMTAHPVVRDGRAAGVSGGWRDVQAEVAAFDQLQQARERLDLVLESSRLGLWDWNMQTGEVVFNERWAQIVGYTLADLEPVSIDTWVRLAQADDLEVSERLIAAHAAGEAEFYDIEARMRHRDGHWVWVRDRGRIVEWDAAGRPLRMTGTHEDITELKAVTEQVRASEARNRTVVEATASGLVVQAGDGSIVDANTAAERMLGLTRDQLQGRTSHDPRWRSIREDGSDFPGAEHPAMVTLTTGQPQTGVVMGIEKPDGTLTWLMVDSAPLTRPESPGEPAVVTSFTDITASRAAELALAVSETRYRLLAENASDMVALADNDGILQWFSPSVSSLGWTPEDLIGRPARDLVHPEDLPQLADSRRAIAAGRTSVVELRYRTKDGAWRWFRVRLRPVTDVDGTVVGRVSGWQDIDTERRISEELRASEEKYRLLAETMSDLVEEYDPTWHAVWASPSVTTLLGWTPQEMVGRFAPDLIHPDDDRQDDRDTVDSDLAATVPEYRRRVRRLRADGSYVWVDSSLSFRYDENGEHVATYITSRDIDAQVAAEHALIESQQRFSRMFAEHGAIMLLVDPAGGTIVDANAAAAVFYGYDTDSLRGMNIADINTLAPEEIRLRRLAAADRGQNAFVFPHRLADGTERTVLVHSSPIDDGDRVLLFSIIRDITDEIAARDALAASEERFRMLAESIGDVVLVHDVDGIVEWVSPSVRRVLGLDPQAIAGTAVAALMHPDDAHDPRSHLADDPGLHESMCRARWQHADGTTRWMDTRTTFRTDPGGVVTGGYSVVRDVQTQVIAEQALRDSESRYRLLAENATDFVAFADLDGDLQWVSPSTRRVLGRDPDDMLGRNTATLVHPDDQSALADLVRQVSEGAAAVARLRVTTTAGWRWFLASCRPVRADGGTLIGRVTGFQDVQAETQAREEVRRAHERLELVLQSSQLGLWDWNMRTGAMIVNDRWAEIVGYTLTDLGPATIDTWEMLTDPDDLAAAEAATAAHAAGRTEFYDFETRMRHRDGHWVWIRSRGRIVDRDDDGTPLRMTGTHEDVTTIKQAVDALAASEERFRVVMASAPVGMAVLDLQRRFVQVNPALCDLLSRAETWLLDHTLADVLDGPDDTLDRRMRVHLASAPTQSVTIEHRVLRADGAYVWVQQALSALLDPDGEVMGFVSQFTDITEAREARRRLRDLAGRDPLTDLLNRRELTARIDALLARRQRTGTDLAALFIDLDGLKGINDTYGHLAGDQVIQQVARRIRAVVRHDDVVARYGGDEFVVLLPQIHHTGDAERIAEHIQATSAEPVMIDGREVPVTYSIGLATTAGSADPATLLARADAAVYRAKRDGRNRTVVFDPELDAEQARSAQGS